MLPTSCLRIFIANIRMPNPEDVLWCLMTSKPCANPLNDFIWGRLGGTFPQTKKATDDFPIFGICEAYDACFGDRRMFEQALFYLNRRDILTTYTKACR